MSDTPRTDCYPTPKHGYVPVAFARGLEREVAGLRKELAEVTEAFQKECDHEFEKVDDSFDHEFGTEVIRYLRCEKCAKVAEWGDVPHPDDVL